MNATSDEQLFIEQVLESVASIQKYDHIDIETAKVIGGISNILGSVTFASSLACTSASVLGLSAAGAIVGNIFRRDIGDIPINQSENENDENGKKIKTALEIAGNELFDYDKERNCVTTAVVACRQRKIKKIISDSLCPSLLKTSDDVFEIAKSSTPVLLTLSLSGTISLPIQPVFFAAAAILLARSSIAAICKDSNQSASK